MSEKHEIIARAVCGTCDWFSQNNVIFQGDGYCNRYRVNTRNSENCATAHGWEPMVIDPDGDEHDDIVQDDEELSKNVSAYASELQAENEKLRAELTQTREEISRYQYAADRLANVAELCLNVCPTWETEILSALAEYEKLPAPPEVEE